MARKKGSFEWIENSQQSIFTDLNRKSIVNKYVRIISNVNGGQFHMENERNIEI